MSTITVVGNVAADPELRFTSSGKAVVSLSIGETPRKRQGNEWVDGETSWHNVQAWNGLAENIAETIRKGHRVIVTGRLEQESYDTREGEKRYRWQITADALGPDLTFATAAITRAARPAAAEDTRG